MPKGKEKEKQPSAEEVTLEEYKFGREGKVKAGGPTSDKARQARYRLAAIRKIRELAKKGKRKKKRRRPRK